MPKLRARDVFRDLVPAIVKHSDHGPTCAIHHALFQRAVNLASGKYDRRGAKKLKDAVVRLRSAELAALQISGRPDRLPQHDMQCGARGRLTERDQLKAELLIVRVDLLLDPSVTPRL